MHTFGRFLILSTAALALAACGKKEEAPVAVQSDAVVATDAAAAPAAAPSPGVYEVTDAAGKKVSTTTINAGGTYAQDMADGHRVAGIVKMVDGKTCFDPSGKAEAECYTESARAADGSFTATDAKGGVVIVHPKAK
jgi:hypothetical protein